MDGDLYLFDVEAPSGDGTTVIVNDGIALVSPDSRLPFFNIHPRMIGDGFAARMANRILNWSSNLGSNHTIQFTGVPQFDDTFLVIKPADTPEEPVRDLLTPDLRRLLSGAQTVNIDAGGEVIAFSASSISAMQKKEPDDRIRSLISDAYRLSPYFFQR